MFLTPVLSERRIGIDQETKNFDMVVVDAVKGDSPAIVYAQNHTSLCLPDDFDELDVLNALTEKN